MKFESISEEELPSQPGGDRAEADAAIVALNTGPISIDVPDAQQARSVRLRLAKAAGREAVRVTTWYDAASGKVYAKLAAKPAAPRPPRKVRPPIIVTPPVGFPD